MEETPFNLESAITDWRNSLKQNGIAAETIEELESHLAESTESLKASGLSEREAFYTATDRLGNPTELSSPTNAQSKAAPSSGSGCLRALGITMLAGGLALLLGAAALIISFFTSPTVYSAHSTLQLNRDHTETTQPYQQFVQTQFAIIKSRKTLDETIETLGLAQHWNINAELVRLRLEKQLRTESVRGTDLIRISYNDPDPELAARITNSIAQSYANRVNQSAGDRAIVIFEIAETASTPNGRHRVFLLAPLAFGILGALLIAIGIATWRRSI